MKHIIIMGRLTEGLALIGPFDDESTALAAGNRSIKHHDWYVEELTAYDPDNLPLLPSDFLRMKPKLK